MSFWLLLPTILLQLIGFYFLGRVLYRSRLWAFLLAVITAAMVTEVGLGEFWGIWRDVLPRFTFQAFLPFCWRWRCCGVTGRAAGPG